MTRRAHLELPHRGPRPHGQDAKPCQCPVPLLDRDHELRSWRCAKCGKTRRNPDPRRNTR